MLEPRDREFERDILQHVAHRRLVDVDRLVDEIEIAMRQQSYAPTDMVRTDQDWLKHAGEEYRDIAFYLPQWLRKHVEHPARDRVIRILQRAVEDHAELRSILELD